MATDKFDLCSRALILCGGRGITSFLGGGAEETTAGRLYEGTVTNLLSKHRWRFSSRQVVMTRLEAAPNARWLAAYQLPAGTQTIHAVTVGDAPISFDRYEDQLLCDAQATDIVVVDVTYRSDESYWPGYFETCLEIKLAARFAIPIADDTDKASYYEAQFLREWATAKSADSQGRTARKLTGVGGLARFHGGRA